VRSHNLLMFDEEQLLDGSQYRAELLAAEFDDQLGGYWQLDLTRIYDGVQQVRRTVAHLNPGSVAILDEADLARPRDVSLRWYTTGPADPDADGRFWVEAERRVWLAARVLRLGGGPLNVTHRWERGFHRCEAELNTPALSVAFCVPCVRAEEIAAPWQWDEQSESHSGMATSDPDLEVVEVEVSENARAVHYRDDKTRGWHVRT